MSNRCEKLICASGLRPKAPQQRASKDHHIGNRDHHPLETIKDPLKKGWILIQLIDEFLLIHTFSRPFLITSYVLIPYSYV